MAQPQMDIHPQVAMQLGLLLRKLSGSEKKRSNGRSVRAEVLDIIKEVEPGYKLPADVEVEHLRAELKAEREKEKREDQESRRKNRRDRERRELVETHGEDVVKAIEEKVLKKYPQLAYEDAAKLYAGEEGPVSPTGTSPERFRHGQIWTFPDLPGLLQNADKAANDAAYAVIDELRSAGRR